MEAPSGKDRVAAFFDKLNTDILPKIDKVTVPLHGVQDDVLKHDRTGVLYQVADHHFILTAAHWLRDIIQHNILLFIPTYGAADPGIPLVGALFHTTEKEIRDVGVIHLDEATAEKLKSRKEFLRHGKVCISDADPEGLYVVFGYPEEWFGRTADSELITRPLPYFCQRYSGETMPDSGYDPQLHMALGFDRNVVTTQDYSRQTLPTARGMSGCGIWRVADCSKEGVERWSTKELRLVGIQHTWCNERKYLLGTRIQYALQVVSMNYPELERPLDLIYPRH